MKAAEALRAAEEQNNLEQEKKSGNSDVARSTNSTASVLNLKERRKK